MLSGLATLVLAAGVFAAIRLVGVTAVIVKTNSMEPTLMPRDYVLTMSPRWSEPHIGSVVVFTPQFDGAALPAFVHRIVGRYPDGTWKTQGDNAHGADPWRVESRQIVAVATSVKLPATITQNPASFGLAGFLIALVLIWPSREPSAVVGGVADSLRDPRGPTV